MEDNPAPSSGAQSDASGSANASDNGESNSDPPPGTGRRTVFRIRQRRGSPPSISIENSRRIRRDIDADARNGSPGSPAAPEDDGNSTDTSGSESILQGEIVMVGEDGGPPVRRRRRRLSPGSSEKFDRTPKCPRPKHNWHTVLEIDKFTRDGRFRTFRQEAYGSLRSVQRLELMATLEGHEGCVNAIGFNDSGTLLASGSDDRRCLVYDWLGNRTILEFETLHRNNVFQTKFMPNKNDRLIVSSSLEGAVRTHELSQGGTEVISTQKVGYHRGAVHKVALHPALSDVILTAGEDGNVNEIDLRIPTPATLFHVKKGSHNSPVALYSIAINPTKPYEFLVSGEDCFVRLYDRRNAKSESVKQCCPEELVNAKKRCLSVSSAVYNFDGTEVLASYSDEDIYVFANDGSGGKETKYLHKYQGHRNKDTVKSVNYFGPRSEYIISGSDCGHIFIWDKETSHIVNFLVADEGGVVNVLEPHPTTPFLATSGFDANVKIWAPSADDEPDLKEARDQACDNLMRREVVTERDEEGRLSERSQFMLLLDALQATNRANRDFLHSDSSNEDEENARPPDCVPS